MASCILLARHALVHRLRFQQSLVWPVGQFILRLGGGGCMQVWRLQLLVVLGFGGVEVGAACFKPAAAVHAKRSWGPGQQTDKAASQWTAGGGVHHTDCHSAHPLAPSSMGRPHCLVLLHASMLSPQHSAVLAAPHRTSHTCLLLASPGDRCDEGDEVN